MAENEIKTYTCPNCGAQITNTRNCEYCGSLLVRFAVHGIDVTKTEYMNDDYVFPGLKEELEKNLKLRKEHPGMNVATDIYKENSDGTMFCISILNSNKTAWLDDTLMDLESSESGLRIDIDFCKYKDSSANKEFNNRMDSELRKFKKLDSFPLFTSHYNQNYITSAGDEKYGYQYAIDFGEDAEGAARLVSEILTKVYGVSVEENVDIFTNVGNDNIDTARNNWYKNHGFDTSTTQNSGCMVAATALLVPAVYAVVKLLGTIV